MDHLATQHQLVAILAADVVGYTRLMSADEDDTHLRWTELRTGVLNPRIAEYRGHFVKNTGDGFLVIFESAQDATDCALDMQRATLATQAEAPPNRRINLRIGINLANIIVEDGEIYGDGVNVAARLQTYANPGGVAVSGAVAEQIANREGITAIDLGDLYLHNMARPVRMFSLRIADGRATLVGEVPAGSDARPSVAVLPFRKNLTDPEEAYFADGIVDDIIYALAGLKELFVIARGSTLGYGGDTINVRQIGQELGVRYVLYGSVRRSGGRLRITTELSDTETGRIVNSNKYDGETGSIFELQDRISIDVVNLIAPHVRERELLRALRKHPQNMTAYDLLLQALDLLFRMDYDSFSRARGLLQQAMALDPYYPSAYSYAAYWYVFRVGEGWTTDPNADAAEAARLAETAIKLNGNDAQALAFYGHVQGFLLKDYDRAMAFLDRAIAAGPSCALAWTMSCATCGYIGETRLAVERGQQGLRLSPLDAHRFWAEGVLAQAHYLNGDIEAAVTLARMAAGRTGAVAFNLRTLTASLVALERMDEAAGAAQQLLRVQPGFRLTPYAQRCPFRGEVLATWVGRLRAAGLPE